MSHYSVMTEKQEIWSRIEAVAPKVDGLTAYNFKKIRNRERIPEKWWPLFVEASKDTDNALTYEQLLAYNTANQ